MINCTKGFGNALTAKTVLDAVELWADGCYLLRETGQVCSGRLDGLLVPVHWEAKIGRGLGGVEVKVSRSDFLRGLKEGQYERYAKNVNLMYVATHKDVCKTSEIPAGIGHLVVCIRPKIGPVCICKRRAVRREMELHPDAMWRIIWDLFDQHRKKQRQAEEELHKLRERICHRGHRIIEKVLLAASAE